MQSPLAPVAPKPDPYAVWRGRGFQLYATSWFLMTFAKQAESVVMSVFVYSYVHNLYHSVQTAALAVGVLGLVQALPMMVLAIPGGQIADRWDRRLVLTVSLAATGAMSAVLAAAVYRHEPLLWIYLPLLLGAVGQALGNPSRTALLPQLVPSEDFSNAVAWNTTVFQIGRVTGPLLGGLIAGIFGTPAALIVALACRLLAMAAAFFLPRQAAAARRAVEAVSWESLVAGVRFVWRQKLILATITLDLFAVLFGGVTYLFAPFARDILNVGQSNVDFCVGMLFAADAVGAISMAVLLAHLPPIRHAGRTMLWAVAAFGAVTIVFGVSTWFWLSFATMFVVGAVDAISVVVRHTLVQMLTPDAMRGRVSAVNSVFIVASNDLGGLESGLTAWLVGPVISVVGGGILTILVVLASTRVWPQLLGIGSLRDIHPEEEERN
ncbi:MAG: MFS transporter [Thermoguttaceae bacterium]